MPILEGSCKIKKCHKTITISRKKGLWKICTTIVAIMHFLLIFFLVPIILLGGLATNFLAIFGWVHQSLNCLFPNFYDQHTQQPIYVTTKQNKKNYKDLDLMTIRLLWLFGPWEKKICQWIVDFVVWSTPLGVGHPSTNIQVLQTSHNNGTL